MLNKLNVILLILLIFVSIVPPGFSLITSQKIISTEKNPVNKNVLLGFEKDVSGQAVEMFYKYFFDKLSTCAQTNKTLTFHVFIIEKPIMSFVSMKEVIQAVKNLNPIFIGGSTLNVEFANILKGENITYYDIFTFPMEYSFSAVNYILQRTFYQTNALNDVFIIHSELSNFPMDDIRKLLPIFGGNVEVFPLTSDANSILNAILRISNTNSQNVLVFASQDESYRISINARNLSLFNFQNKWMFFNSRLPFNLSQNIPDSSKNLTFIDVGKRVFIIKNQLFSEMSTKLYDVVQIVFNLFEYSTACNTSQIGDDTLGLDTTGQILINGTDMTISRIKWQLIFHVELNPSLQSGFYLRNPEEGLVTTFPPILKISNNLQATVIHIVAFLEPPFVQFVPNAKNFSTTKDKLQGYCIDLLKYVLDRQNVTYDVTLLQIDSLSDNFDDIWNGMLNNLRTGKYAMIANFYPKPIPSGVDRSISFNQNPASIVYRKNLQATFIQAFNFIVPFDGWLWLAIFGSILLITVVLTLMNYFLPNKHDLSLPESLFFSFGSTLQSLTVTPPNIFPGRIVALTFWIFCLAICVTYFCNYGSVIISNIINTDAISDFNSLLNSPNYIFGTVKNSVYQQFLKDNSVAALSQMHDTMHTYSDWLVSTPQRGIDRVNQGNYAFIYHSSNNKYATSQYCGLVNTMQFGSFEEKFLIQQNVPWKDSFNQWLQDAVANNVVTNIYAKYFGDVTYVACKESVILAYTSQYVDFFHYLSFIPQSNLLTQQQFANMIGIFFVMICGSIIVVFVALLERVVQNIYNKRHRRQRYFQKHELKKTVRNEKNPYESYA